MFIDRYPLNTLKLPLIAQNSGGIAFWRSVGYRDYCLTLEIIPE